MHSNRGLHRTYHTVVPGSNSIALARVVLLLPPEEEEDGSEDESSDDDGFLQLSIKRDHLQSEDIVESDEEDGVDNRVAAKKGRPRRVSAML